MKDFLNVADVSRRFGPQLSLGDRIAAKLGANVETRVVHAVDGVALTVRQGETLGLVGESGCGKSTLGRVMAGILPPSEGDVTLDGAPVMRGGVKTTTRVQTVFQDPFASLDPRMKVGDAVAEGPIAHGLTTKAEAKTYVADWFARVGLDPHWADRYPHQFSGGQRQRLAIARALAMQPDLLICDEPVASLDVSIQAQIINLFLELRRDLGLTCVFISHDLSVVEHVSDRVAVMYLGRIVELGETQAVFDNPAHPYTRALLASVPKLVLDGDELVTFQAIEGEVPSPLSPPPGCHYNPRCPLADAGCAREVPAFRALDGARSVACHHPLRD
ncbi:ATP-binding cassette domain-containing protein [Sulfitobacter albidus]|uniref:Glutathione import ATP-binding protein GsiA n=1 Tax=Sulfitobacter albidus TaxID=2829501 RepID=A0A975JEW3_9RHOB|nr:oligopeptide/dipeptide ABC transporter ATP-binding protein [Sulfitobacter albidus]QUJ77227.1 ATP-binding cassette domain-containing protein [Sulfitobacter albidus]